MNLIEIYQKSIKNFAGQPALTMRMGYRTVHMTYADVAVWVGRMVALLEAQGCGKGDTVILCAPNSPYWVVVWWACVVRGCWVVPLATQTTQGLINKIAGQTKPKLFVGSQYVALQLEGVRTIIIEQLGDEGSCPSIHPTSPQSGYDGHSGRTGENIPTASSSDAEHRVSRRPYERQPQDADIAEIMYTSGTTGDPKGVLLTHENIASNVHAVQDIFNFAGKKERVLSVLPLSHMLEQTAGFLVPFSIGAHIVYAHSHGAIRELLQQYRITKIIAIPELLKLMAARVQTQIEEHGRQRTFERLRRLSRALRWKRVQRMLFWPLHAGLGTKLDTFASGGSALDPDLEQWWDDVGMHVLQGYGLTETSPIVSINTYEERRIGSVGKPIVGVQIRLVNDGEIEVRGPNVFSGYFKNDEKTRECFTSDGWFITGDMGSMDADGFLFLKGRKKYMIKGHGAQNVFPEDIEVVLNAIEGVRDSCVVGIEKKGMMEIHAVILAAPGVSDVTSMIHNANSQLLSYQAITGWSVWPEEDFPRSVTRKVKKELVITWLKEHKNHAGNTQKVASTHPIVAVLAEISGIPVSDIHAGTTLGFDLKFDSLMRVELITRIEELQGILIDERLITPDMTVAQLERCLATAQPVVKMPRVKLWPRAWWARILRCIGFGVMRLLTPLLCKIRIQGVENLAQVAGPILLMPNHVTMLDALFVAAALPKNIRSKVSFAAAYDVLYQDYWWVRWAAELFFNAFPFPRKEHEHIVSGVLNIGTMLDSGYSVVIFPEGMISKDGALLPLKRGTGFVAVEMACPVVPVKISGAEKMVPYDCLFPRRRGDVTVTFGAPMTFTHATTYDQATEQIERELRKL